MQPSAVRPTRAPAADAASATSTAVGARPSPPAAEAALGLSAFLTTVPGIGGRLRGEPEDFRVVELGDPPREAADGKHTAVRVELRNWETNRFIQQAAQALGVSRERVGFAGMKDKRAVTEQWFTFPCPPERLTALGQLGTDVRILSHHRTAKAHFAGAHSGNGFVIRVRDAAGASDRVPEIVDAIAREGGVPNYFGPQRFGAFRPVTHLVGRALVRGDLEEAVRLYVGNPMPGERVETAAARRIYEDTRDPEAALAAFPPQLDPERAILRRLVERPGDWRHALQALPENLLQLFVHAHQSFLFNLVLSERVGNGLGLATAHVGDRVMADGDDGTATHLVTETNHGRVQRELDKGRAFVTAPLVGLQCPLAEGEPGEIERRVLTDNGVDLRDFRLRELPEVASDGRRRAVLQPVRGLNVEWVDGDPVFAFELGKGSYATVVLREFMKTRIEDY